MHAYIHTYIHICRFVRLEYLIMYVCMYVGEAEYVSMQQELLQLSRRLQDEVAPCGKRVCMYVYGHKALPVVFAGLSFNYRVVVGPLSFHLVDGVISRAVGVHLFASTISKSRQGLEDMAVKEVVFVIKLKL